MRYNLFLDNDRFPADVTWINIGPGPWVIVRNSDEFKDYTHKYGIPEKVSFDHDLGLGSYDGKWCAEFLALQCEDQGVKYPTYTVHSMNPVGAANIINFIEWIKEHL